MCMALVGDALKSDSRVFTRVSASYAELVPSRRLYPTGVEIVAELATAKSRSVGVLAVDLGILLIETEDPQQVALRELDDSVCSYGELVINEEDTPGRVELMNVAYAHAPGAGLGPVDLPPAIGELHNQRLALKSCTPATAFQTFRVDTLSQQELARKCHLPTGAVVQYNVSAEIRPVVAEVIRHRFTPLQIRLRGHATQV